MRPFADTGCSYIDSPAFDDGPLGIQTFMLTAVAVDREADGDHLLSTYYFEFDNSTRKITKRDPDFTGEYDAGMKTWNGE